jgi:hypothetical protein
LGLSLKRSCGNRKLYGGEGIMWGRVIEFMLGVWLAISWVIFDYKDHTGFLWHDYIFFFLIASFSLLSYYAPWRHLHLMNFLVALWLAFFSYFTREIGFEKQAQNYMTLAWLLLIFSIIPIHSRYPPYPWMKFLTNQKK